MAGTELGPRLTLDSVAGVDFHPRVHNPIVSAKDDGTCVVAWVTSDSSSLNNARLLIKGTTVGVGGAAAAQVLWSDVASGNAPPYSPFPFYWVQRLLMPDGSMVFWIYHLFDDGNEPFTDIDRHLDVIRVDQDLNVTSLTETWHDFGTDYDTDQWKASWPVTVISDTQIMQCSWIGSSPVLLKVYLWTVGSGGITRQEICSDFIGLFGYPTGSDRNYPSERFIARYVPGVGGYMECWGFGSGVYQAYRRPFTLVGSTLVPSGSWTANIYDTMPFDGAGTGGFKALKDGTGLRWTRHRDTRNEARWQSPLMVFNETASGEILSAKPLDIQELTGYSPQTSSSVPPTANDSGDWQGNHAHFIAFLDLSGAPLQVVYGMQYDFNFAFAQRGALWGLNDPWGVPVSWTEAPYQDDVIPYASVHLPAVASLAGDAAGGIRWVAYNFQDGDEAYLRITYLSDYPLPDIAGELVENRRKFWRNRPGW